MQNFWIMYPQTSETFTARTNDFHNIFEKKSNFNMVVSPVPFFSRFLFFNSTLEGGHTKLLGGQISSTSVLTDCIVERTILIIFSKKNRT